MISRYFDDTVSDIVTKMCKELDIKCETTKSVGKVKKVLPYDSVFSHITNISKQARASENPKDVDFIFYQDIDHKFYFKPLSSFKKKEVKSFQDCLKSSTNFRSKTKPGNLIPR